MLCVCVYALAHTLHVGYSDVSLGVGTRHLESPEEIQMYCSDSIHIYRAVYEGHMHTYICWATGRSLHYLPFCFLLTYFSFHRKEEHVSKTTDISDLKQI